MAPEMIARQPHGWQVDIWGQAVCVLELANHRPPDNTSVRHCVCVDVYDCVVLVCTAVVCVVGGGVYGCCVWCVCVVSCVPTLTEWAGSASFVPRRHRQAPLARPPGELVRLLCMCVCLCVVQHARQ